MSNSRDSTTPFRCPVCRARQELSRECRRCKADLELVYRIRKRLEFVQSLPASGVRTAELHLLDPSN